MRDAGLRILPTSSALRITHSRLIRGITEAFESQKQRTCWPGRVTPRGIKRHQFWGQGFRKLQEDSVFLMQFGFTSQVLEERLCPLW